MLLVDTESLFPGDVTIALDEEDVNTDRRLNEIRGRAGDIISRHKKKRRLSHDKKYKSKCKDQPWVYFTNGKAEEKIETKDPTVTDKAVIYDLEVTKTATFGDPLNPDTFKLAVDGAVDADKFQVVTLSGTNILDGNEWPHSECWRHQSRIQNQHC